MEGGKSSEVDEHEQAATAYVERYLGVVENFPNELQRVITQVRELDTRTCMELKEYQTRHSTFVRDLTSGDTSARARSHIALRRSLLRERELGDEKLQLANQLVDMVEGATRVLDEDFQHLEAVQTDPDYSMANGGSYARHDYHQADHAAHGGPSGVGTSAASTSNSLTHQQAYPANAHHQHQAGSTATAGSSSHHHYQQARSDERGTHQASGPNPKRRKSKSKQQSEQRDPTDDAMTTSSAHAHKESSSSGGPGTATTAASGGGAAAAASATSAAASAVTTTGHSTGASVGRPVKQGNRKPRVKDKMSKRTESGERGGGSSSQKNSSSSGSGVAVKPLATVIPSDTVIDPNEPTYCVCHQVSYGEMIGCDNTSCEIEWFHFACVSLVSKPKGKWYCPNCRRDHHRADQAKLSTASEKSSRGR
eukprot:scpid94465/ scgid22583/ Inhibitor of growth protein 2; Inhibitor of growth 1-like protein; p32; p33ING2